MRWTTLCRKKKKQRKIYRRRKTSHFLSFRHKHSEYSISSISLEIRADARKWFVWWQTVVMIFSRFFFICKRIDYMIWPWTLVFHWTRIDKYSNSSRVTANYRSIYQYHSCGLWLHKKKQNSREREAIRYPHNSINCSLSTVTETIEKYLCIFSISQKSLRQIRWKIAQNKLEMAIISQQKQLRLWASLFQRKIIINPSKKKGRRITI